MFDVIAAALLVCASGDSRCRARPSRRSRTGPRMHRRHTTGTTSSSMARDGSGTSWLPEASPMYAFHAAAAGWQLMAHGNVFLQFLHESGARGADQGGSINWFMGMAQRPVGDGPAAAARHGQPRAVDHSAAAAIPDLLATGERVRRRGDSRSPASARSVHGAVGPLRRAARRVGCAGRSMAGRPASRRSAGGVSASRLGDAQSAGRRSRITGSTRRTSRSAS